MRPIPQDQLTPERHLIRELRGVQLGSAEGRHVQVRDHQAQKALQAWLKSVDGYLVLSRAALDVLPPCDTRSLVNRISGLVRRGANAVRLTVAE